MAGWHHQLKGYEFEQAPGDGEGQGSLACYSPWGCKESDTTKQLKAIKQLASGQLLYNMGSSAQCSVTTQRGRMGGWEGVSEGGDICTLKADSRSYIAETNTTMQNNYPPTKNKLKKRQQAAAG